MRDYQYSLLSVYCEICLVVILLRLVVSEIHQGESKSNQLTSVVGQDDFRTLRLDESVFVDKSEMINEYLERGGVVLIITKPRKWGKTINISMFKYFFDIEVDENGVAVSDENKQNSVLFTGGVVKLHSGKVVKIRTLKIAQYLSAMEHQGSNPVVLLSFKDINGNTYEEFENAIRIKMKLTFKTYPYLSRYVTNLTGSDSILNESTDILDNIKLDKSLYFLSKILFRHFQRNVYIFIDDYDTPIANAFMAFGSKIEEFNKVVDMIYRIVRWAFKDNWYLERGILTGTFHFGWLNEILRLSNVRHSTVIDTTFSRFYGFTQKEVNKLLKTLPNNVTLEKIQEWYNGYNFESDTIYNPWSTLSCLVNKGQLGHYWNSAISSTNNLANSVLLLDEAQEYLQQLLQGKIVTRKDINKPINLKNIKDTFHRTLLFGGYFNSVSSTCDSHCYIHPWNLSLPNREVRAMVAEGVSNWVANKLGITLNEYLNLTKLLLELQIDHFKDAFQKYLLNSSLPKTFDNQQQYHLLIGGLLSSLADSYTVRSRRKPGQQSREYILVAYPDIGYNKIIVEFEVGKAPKKLPTLVERGLKRMKNKQYALNTTKQEHVQQVIKIYLGISKKKVAAKYEISRLD